MRILHVLDHSVPIQDGYSYRTLAILRGQRALGWHTAHLTSGKHGPVAALEETVGDTLFYRTPPPHGLRGRLPVIGQLAIITDLERRLAQVIDIERPDVLHAHSPALNGVAAVRIGRRRRIPVVYEIRGFWEDAAVDQGTSSEWGPRYRATRALESWVLRRADRVTTICEGLRAEIESRGIAAGKIIPIPNGADPDGLRARGAPDRELSGRLGLSGAIVVGFIGSFYAYEGLHVLVDAVALIARRRPEVKVLLVGGGLEAGRLRAQVERLGLTERVILTGPVPHDAVADYYDLIDILVYPRVSIRLTELVTPLKPLEAMSRGQLVLASNVGGHRELVRDADNGYLFPPDDPAALAEAVLQAIERRAQWQQIQQRARCYVREERSWTRSIERYRDVYGPLLAGGRA